MTTIGPGLIILAVVWLIAIIGCLLLSRAQGGIALAGPALIIVAIVITLVLWLLPRGPPPQMDYIVYDYTYIPRVVIVSVCGILLAFGLVIVGFVYMFSSLRAKPLKPVWN